MAFNSGKEEANIASCSIYNAIYHTTFNFVNGVLETTTGIDVQEAALGIDPADSGTRNITNNQFAYESLMMSFARIMNGGISVDHYGAYTETATLVRSTPLGDYIGKWGDKEVAWSDTFTAVENTFHNIILSLYTNELFL